MSDRTRSGKVSKRKRYKQTEAAMRAWQPRCYVTGWLRHQDAGDVVDIGDTFAGACTDLGYGFHCPGGSGDGSALLRPGGRAGDAVHNRACPFSPKTGRRSAAQGEGWVRLCPTGPPLPSSRLLFSFLVTAWPLSPCALSVCSVCRGQLPLRSFAGVPFQSTAFLR